MHRKIQITLFAALAITLLAVLLLSTTVVQARPSAQATATPTAAMEEMDEEGDAANAYCEQQGGTVTTRRPAYNTNGSQDQWLMLAGSMDFCTFLAEPDSSGFQSQISIGVDTLYASEPTLAVLAYLEPVALPPFTGANPSTLYCQKLGGTDIWGGMDNAAGGGWVTEAPDSATNFQVVGMCVFPDMSVIDSWGLTYKANGVVRGVDLSTVVNYKPTSVPSVFVGSSSSGQPAEGAVDQTLTQADNGESVTLAQGDILKIELPSNPSTGYSWHIASNSNDVLAPVGQPQFSLGSQTPMPGAGGTETFTFKAVAAGESTLTLIYNRPWETNVTPTPDDTFTVTVTVP